MSEAARSHSFPDASGSGVRPVLPAWAMRATPEVRAHALGARAAPPPPPAPEPAPVVVAEPPPPPVVEVAPPVPSLPPPPDPATERALREAAQALTRARADVLSGVEGEVLTLAVDIATVLLEDELETRPELHRALVRAALRHVEPSAGVRVRASRVTYDALLQAFDEAAVDAGRGRVAVELDPSLDGAGVVVDVDGASIDGRVEPRLEMLRAALDEARRARRAA